jgi:hypothetical protein
MGRTSFLPTYDTEFAGKLDLRSETFRRMFEILEAMDKSRYTIVETGCARIVDNWQGDGQSTILFDRFVNHHEGVVLTVDIDGDACTQLRGRVSGKTTVTASDSVAYLDRLARADAINIDLLYLDAYDLDIQNPHPSSLHHLLELCAAMPLIAGGTLVVVDDSPRGLVVVPGTNRILGDLGIVGKGKYVADFFDRIGCKPAIEGYQHGWIMP